ncbi:MAG: hypothetical protein OEU25_15875 [Rhodospirillales bacterium]|nr:hypothetical protein [Rhodospirillales bacterium]MDH3919642.1 hypothetical protein [Rhodospirillales bacterium]
MESDDFPAEEGARVANWLDGLLTRGLCLPEGLTEAHRAREMAGARAAAEGLAGELWGEGAGLEARVQAAQFVCAHAAAMDCQAEANRRDLPPHARATSQRLARQLMALTTAQLGALCRLRAERRKEREQTARLEAQAARLAAQETAAKFKAWSADRRALVADLEQTLKATAEADREAMADFPGSAGGFAGPSDADLDEMADLALALAAPPPGTAPPDEDPVTPPRSPRPEPVGAGVPEPPPEPAPPLNRRQRRALERLRRKERRREGVG